MLQLYVCLSWFFYFSLVTTLCVCSGSVHVHKPLLFWFWLENIAVGLKIPVLSAQKHLEVHSAAGCHTENIDLHSSNNSATTQSCLYRTKEPLTPKVQFVSTRPRTWTGWKRCSSPLYGWSCMNTSTSYTTWRWSIVNRVSAHLNYDLFPKLEEELGHHFWSCGPDCRSRILSSTGRNLNAPQLLDLMCRRRRWLLPPQLSLLTRYISSLSDCCSPPHRREIWIMTESNRTEQSLCDGPAAQKQSCMLLYHTEV